MTWEGGGGGGRAVFTATALLKAPSPWALQAHTLRMRTWQLSTVNPGFLPECHQHLASNHAAVPFGDPTPWESSIVERQGARGRFLALPRPSRLELRKEQLEHQLRLEPQIFPLTPTPRSASDAHAALQSLRHAVRTGCPALGTAGRAHLRWCRRPGSRPATLQAVSGPAYTSLPPPPSSAASTLPHRPRNRPREQRPRTTLA